MITYLYEIRLHDQFKHSSMWSDREHQIQDEHLSYLEKLAELGDIEIAFIAGIGLEGQTSIIILSSTSYNQAKEIVNNDPSIKYGMMSAQLRPVDVYFKKIK